MSKSFDLVVLGVGTAASTAARVCADAGWSVAVVDERPYGGTCPLRGCDPKKMLRRGAEIIDGARRLRGKGIEDDGLKINWADLVAFKRSFTEAMPPKVESGLENAGIATLHGTARFVARNAVEVDGERLEARHFVIATGAKPRPMDTPGAEHLTDSTDFMELEALPRRIVFVGGGYITMEFAHIAARAGSEIRVIERGARPLKAFDADLVERLVAHSTSVGIDISTGTTLLSVEKAGDKFAVTVERDGRSEAWAADLVVHGAGRVPAIDQLDLAAAGIDADKTGVLVNDHLQSVSHPAVYAAGDVAASPGKPLTPVAALEGKAAAANLLNGNSEKPDYCGVPSAVFTIPELTGVGLLESEAKERGLNVRVAFNDTGGWFSNLRVGESCAATKVLIDDDSDTIVGAHLLGPHYAEVINVFGLAIRLGFKTGDLKGMVSAYPSVLSDLGSML